MAVANIFPDLHRSITEIDLGAVQRMFVAVRLPVGLFIGQDGEAHDLLGIEIE